MFIMCNPKTVDMHFCEILIRYLEHPLFCNLHIPHIHNVLHRVHRNPIWSSSGWRHLDHIVRALHWEVEIPDHIGDQYVFFQQIRGHLKKFRYVSEIVPGSSQL